MDKPNGSCMPAVSVIVTFHNLEAYIEQCLSSLINQSLSDIEILCVDDSSTDDTPGLLRSFASIDSRIQLLRCGAKNVCVARNTGMSQARGEYVAFLDGDDHVDHEYYECLYTAARTSWPGGADGARSGYTNFRADSEDDDRFCAIIDQRVKDGCLLSSWDNSNVVWNAVYRRETLLARDCAYFPDEPRIAEDLFWTLRATHRLRTMIPVPGVRYRHRVGRSGSLSALTLPFVLGVLHANGMALAYVNSAIWQSLDEYYRQFERILWRYSVWEGRLVALAGGDSDKIADLRRTMRSAYESCRHPAMKERLAKNNWWPGFTKAIEEAKADVRGLAQDPGTDALSRKISVVHPKWRGRLTLRPEGRLVHDQTGDLGTYTEDGDGSSLVVRWDTFATEVFVNIDGTYVLQK